MSKLKIAVAGTFAGLLALAVLCFWLNDEWPAPTASTSKTPTTGVMTEALDRLIEADNVQQRRLAAQLLGRQLDVVSSNVLVTFDQALRTDPDPAVRAAVANALGEMLERQPTLTRAPQVLEILRNAYAKESVAGVRRCIVSAAGNLTTPDAASFIAQAATEDQDADVRKTALEIQLRRARMDSRTSLL